MRQFKDNEGRTWDVAVHPGNIERVRDIHGVNLASLASASELAKLSDFVKLVAVIFVVCRPEIELRGLTDEQFGQAMVGDALADALDALWGAVEDFFPSRLPQRTEMQKIKAASLVLEKTAVTAVNQIDPQVIAELVSRGPLNNPLITSNGAMK